MTWPECPIDFTQTTFATGVERQDDLVGFVGQHIYDAWAAFAIFLDFALLDIQQGQLGLVYTLVKAIDLVTYLLTKSDDKILIAYPVQTGDFHFFRIEFKGFLFKIGGVINLEYRIGIPGWYFH